MRPLFIGCAIFLFVVVVICSVLLYRLGTQKVENIEVSVDAPASVKRGDKFTIVAHVRNTASREQKLIDLDIADEYLAGIALSASNPPAKGSTHIPLDNSISYHFERTIAAGQQLDITYQAEAVQSGDFRGDFDFCIGSDSNFITHSVRTVVE